MPLAGSPDHGGRRSSICRRGDRGDGSGRFLRTAVRTIFVRTTLRAEVAVFVVFMRGGATSVLAGGRTRPGQLHAAQRQEGAKRRAGGTPSDTTTRTPIGDRPGAPGGTVATHGCVRLRSIIGPFPPPCPPEGVGLRHQIAVPSKPSSDTPLRLAREEPPPTSDQPTVNAQGMV